jgi:hypothetical protein
MGASTRTQLARERADTGSDLNFLSMLFTPDAEPAILSMRCIVAEPCSSYDWHTHPFYEFSFVSDDSATIGYRSCSRIAATAALNRGPSNEGDAASLLGRHFAARLRTTAASRYAIVHLADTLAVSGAGFADLRADATGQHVAR